MSWVPPKHCTLETSPPPHPPPHTPTTHITPCTPHLVEVPRQDELYAAKGRLAAAHPARHRLQHVKQPAVHHGQLQWGGGLPRVRKGWVHRAESAGGREWAATGAADKVGSVGAAATEYAGLPTGCACCFLATWLSLPRCAADAARRSSSLQSQLLAADVEAIETLPAPACQHQPREYAPPLLLR